MHFSPDSSGTSYVSIYVITAIGLARTRLDEIEKIRNDSDTKFETEQRILNQRSWNAKKWFFFNKKHDRTFDEEFRLFLDSCQVDGRLWMVYPSQAHNAQFEVCVSIATAASYSTAPIMWISRQDMKFLTRKVLQ